MTRKKIVFRLLLLFLSVLNRRPVLAAVINADDFIQDIKNIADNGLGVSSMQYYIDTQVSFVSTTIQGEAIITKLKQSLSEIFQDRFDVILELKKTIEREWLALPATSPYLSCCSSDWDLRTLYDERFRSQVDVSRPCVREPLVIPTRYAYANEAILRQFQDNMAKVHAVKWQYYSTMDGIFFSYPAQKDPECLKNDPRFRPWYVETVTPILKDVVIVVDTSGSMSSKYGSGRLIDLAKEATKTVVRTLNPKDRLAVLEFDNYPAVLGTGSIANADSQLVQATPTNTKILVDSIDMLHAVGDTYYARAMEKAFDLLNGTTTDIYNTTRRRVILFLSDGDPNDLRHVITVIKDRNTAMGKHVTIITFGIGQVSSYGQQVLLDMSTECQNRPGYFKMISDAAHLHDLMAFYYEFFIDYHTWQELVPVVSEPYLDQLGLGLVITVSLPLMYNDSLIGVVAADISLAELLYSVTHMQEGACTYGFIVDQAGLTRAHPLLPTPDQLTAELVYLNINHLERCLNNSDVIASMMRGESGRQAGLESSTLTNTYSNVDGVQYHCKLSEYFWAKVPGTDFSVAVVVGDHDKTLKITLDGPVRNVSFTYHELGLNEHLELCKHYRRAAVKDTTTVKFGASALTHPFEYLDVEETEDMVSNYTDYIYGRTTNPILKDQVREQVLITDKAFEFWFIGNKSTATYSVWRFIAMSSGVIRISPGITLNKNYDPTTRPWYERAIQWKMKRTLSPPYLDAFGAGYVVTLSQALLEGRPTRVHSPADRVVGVMAIDFTVSYLYYLLEERYPSCQNTAENRCFVMNGAGYLIVHTDFIRSIGGESHLLENRHITVMERGVAYSLISSNIMRKQTCTNIYNTQEQEFYEVVLNDTLDHMTGTPAFILDPIPETNVILGLVKLDNLTPPCVCSDPRSIEPPKCQLEKSVCECPCYREGDFDDFDDTCAANKQTCVQKAVQLDVTADLLEDHYLIGDLEDCFDPKCKELTNGGCFSTAGCQWCQKDNNATNLDEPYCDNQDVCFFGQLGYIDPYAGMFDFSVDFRNSTNATAGPGGLSGALSGALSGGLIALIAILPILGALAAALFLAYKCCPKYFACAKRRRKTDPASQQQSPDPNPVNASSDQEPEDTASNMLDAEGAEELETIMA